MDVGVIILQTCAVCCLDVSMWHCHGWSVRNRFTLVRIPCPFWRVCFQCNSKHVTAAVRIRKAESSVLALASAPVVKRNIGSTTRAVRDFRGPSGKNFAGAVFPFFVWVEYFILKMKCWHWKLSLQKSWALAHLGGIIYVDVSQGRMCSWVGWASEVCPLFYKSVAFEYQLAHLIVAEWCNSPFKFSWYIWLSCGWISFFFEKWQHSGYYLKIALILTIGSTSGFNSSWITAQNWLILSYAWISELSFLCTQGGLNRGITDNKLGAEATIANRNIHCMIFQHLQEEQ